MAVAVLWAAGLRDGPVFASFLAAGGVPSLVRLLRKSRCPITLVYTVTVIGNMLCLPTDAFGVPTPAAIDLAEKFYLAGEKGKIGRCPVFNKPGKGINLYRTSFKPIYIVYNDMGLHFQLLQQKWEHHKSCLLVQQVTCGLCILVVTIWQNPGLGHDTGMPSQGNVRSGQPKIVSRKIEYGVL